MDDGSDNPKAADGLAVSKATGAFELLHPGVQRQLWRMRWTELRPVQAESIRWLMGNGAGDLIISAGTASGKTEAAFLPVLSKIADSAIGSVRALYVGPLKALINDQFGRIGELCEYLDLPVYDWHGDVAVSRKAKLIDRPGGVLLITPESLESLFVNRSEHLVRLFGGLRFVVIDELHSFLDNERGLHLRSLLCRLDAVVQGHDSFRTIGLSATIGDPVLARRFLNPDRPEEVAFVHEQGDNKELKLRLHGYRIVPFGGESQTDNALPHVDQMASDLVTHCHGASNLVFANAKAQVEELADACQRLGRMRGISDSFLVHHGSLAAAIREDAEATMKSGVIATTFCSSTLEMGIDIGSVRMVGQIGPPWSVASLKQRMGRSGRKDGDPRILRIYVTCDEPSSDASLFERLHLDLIQAIAVTELMLGGWVEPPSPPVCDLSTLTQQIISVIAQVGGVRADELFDRLCQRGAFRDIEQSLFARLLRQLASKDIIEQAPEGDLILGLAGERLRKSRGFYAVFPTPNDYAVWHGSERIGTLSTAVQRGEHLLLAGRRWQVTVLDEEKLEIHVVPARGWKPPSFSGGGGAVHPRIRQEMRNVLAASTQYVYLDSISRELLGEARRAAMAAQVCSSAVLPLGPRSTAVMTWTGTRIQDTTRLLFETVGLKPVDEEIALVLGLPLQQARPSLRQLLAKSPGRMPHLPSGWSKGRRKYDWLLDEELLEICETRGWLDFRGAHDLLHEITRSEAGPASP